MLFSGDGCCRERHAAHRVETSWNICGAILLSDRNRLTDVQGRSALVLYSPARWSSNCIQILGLHQDCTRIVDCDFTGIVVESWNVVYHP